MIMKKPLGYLFAIALVFHIGFLLQPAVGQENDATTSGNADGNASLGGRPPPGALRRQFSVSIDRGDGEYRGFATLIDGAKLEVDMKFTTDNVVRCARAFGAESSGVTWGWYRMCQDAARFGTLRLAGTLTPEAGNQSSFKGSLGAEGRFLVDVIYRVTNGCVTTIGTRGVGADYRYLVAECTEDLPGQPDEQADNSFWPGAGENGPTSQDVTNQLNDWFANGGNKDNSGQGENQQQADGSSNNTIPSTPDQQQAQTGTQAPLVPGMSHSLANNLGPTPDADDDLFPKPDFGYLQAFLPSKSAAVPEPESLAVIQLSRAAPGQERLQIETFNRCHPVSGTVSQAFCEMAKAIAGQTVTVEDYGFNGQFGVGRFVNPANKEETWFVRLHRTGSGKVEAEFINGELHGESELGVNPAAKNPAREFDGAGKRLPVANEDLYPLEGYGHLLAFIEHRMPVSSGRPNVLVQSGDLVLKDDKRLYVDDYGQCPPNMSARFCSLAEANRNRSFPLESYRFNTKTGMAEVAIGGARYMLVLSKSDSARIKAQFYRIDENRLTRFRTLLGPDELSKGDETDEDFEACVAKLNPNSVTLIQNPVNHHGVPLAWCASNGACFDGGARDQYVTYSRSICELAYLEQERRAGRRFVDDGSFQKNSCASPKTSSKGARLKPFHQDGFRADDWVSIVHHVYTYSKYFDDDLKFETCSNCKTIAKLACERIPF